jgi:hypothetical protein
MSSVDFTRLHQLITELEEAIEVDLADSATTGEEIRLLKSDLDAALTRLDQLRQKLQGA